MYDTIATCQHGSQENLGHQDQSRDMSEMRQTVRQVGIEKSSGKVVVANLLCLSIVCPSLFHLPGCCTCSCLCSLQICLHLCNLPCNIPTSHTQTHQSTLPVHCEAVGVDTDKVETAVSQRLVSAWLCLADNQTVNCLAHAMCGCCDLQLERAPLQVGGGYSRGTDHVA